MEAFDALVELAQIDRQGPLRTSPGGVPASSAAADVCLSHAELAAARSLVREAHELLRFSGSPWESPFYRDPVAFVEQLTGALDRALPMALAYLDLLAEPRGVAPVAIYDRAEVER